jgi:hypothetical protein
MKIAEEKLTKVATLIIERVPELREHTLEEIKLLVRYRANEIINNH